MSHLRDGISLRSYAHTNPLQDYVNEGYALFRDMNDTIATDCAFNLMRVKLVKREQPAPEGETAKAEASGNVKEAEATEKPTEKPEEKPEEKKPEGNE